MVYRVFIFCCILAKVYSDLHLINFVRYTDLLMEMKASQKANCVRWKQVHYTESLIKLTFVGRQTRYKMIQLLQYSTNDHLTSLFSLSLFHFDRLSISPLWDYKCLYFGDTLHSLNQLIQ